MTRPTYDQLRAAGRNAERKRVQYLVGLFLKHELTQKELVGRLVPEWDHCEHGHMNNSDTDCDFCNRPFDEQL